jgi:glycosyltransferase involved in cell wall biosynthesis
VKVCIVTTSFPRWAGDSRGTFIFEAARALRDQGLAVCVIAMHSPGAKTREWLEGIEVNRPRYLWPERLEILQKEGGGLPIMWRKSRFARLAILPFILVCTLAVMRHARDCDVVHANWTLSAMAAWLGRFYHRRPIVVTVQGSDIYQATRLPIITHLTRAILDGAQRILALSRSLAEATIALGVSANKVEVVPNGVDTDLFRPATSLREPFLLFVGSLIERKGVKYLIQAMPHVGRAFPAYRLIVVGEGPQRNELSQLAEALGVGDHVTFTGAQSPAEIQMWMRRASLFVLPSVEEGLGVVVLEALASGLPCLASEIGGIPDLITPEVGKLIPPANVEALGEAIVSLLGAPDRWARMSMRARQRAVAHYSWKTIAGRIVAIYQNVLAVEGKR